MTSKIPTLIYAIKDGVKIYVAKGKKSANDFRAFYSGNWRVMLLKKEG